MIFYHPRSNTSTVTAIELLALKVITKPDEPLEIHLTKKELCIIVNALDSINVVLGRRP